MELTNEFNQYLKKSNKVYPNQVKCAITGLKMYDSNQPRPNHLVVRGKTQAGKTGVLTAMIMLIRKFGLEGAMGLSKIYYITGDNTTKLVKQSMSRLSDCFRGEGISCELICMKNSDLKKDIDNVFELTNAIVFIDESHYGTSSEDNILIQWLTSKGLDLKNNKGLIAKNIYIATNSATPYGEINSDLGKWKSYVSLETDEGYIGFEELYMNGNIVPVANPLNKSNADNLFVQLRSHLDLIKDKSGKEKCAVIRVTGKNFAKYKDIAEKYFNVEIFDGSKTEVPYDTIHKMMEHEYEYDIEGKPLLIVVKGAYRMGITIPNYCKVNVGLVFDFADDVKTTEQGLLGRMTGYWNTDDWKDLFVYINSKHYDSLRGCYIEDESNTPDTKVKKNYFVPDEDGDALGFLPYDGDITIPVNTKFEEREYNRMVKDYLEGCDANFNGKSFKDLLFIPGRKITKGYTSNTAFFNSAENTTKRMLADGNNTDKECYTTLYNPFDDTISVKYGKIVKGKYITKYIENTKPVPTMVTD